MHCVRYAAKVAVAVGTGGITIALFLFFHPAVALVTAASIFCIEIMTVRALPRAPRSAHPLRCRQGIFFSLWKRVHCRARDGE